MGDSSLILIDIDELIGLIRMIKLILIKLSQFGHQIYNVFSNIANCFWKGVNIWTENQLLHNMLFYMFYCSPFLLLKLLLP